jgi:hypothetical protein
MLVRSCGVVLGVAALTLAWAGPSAADQIQSSLAALQAPPVRPLQPQQPRPLFPVPPKGQPLPVPPAEQPLTPNRAVTAPKPRVVCGMTLIPTDPKVDPKIASKPDAEKKGDGTKFTIRAVQPTICW